MFKNIQTTRKSMDWFLYDKACNFIKKETLAQVFSCEFCEISKNSFSYRTPTVAASEVSVDVCNNGVLRLAGL